VTVDPHERRRALRTQLAGEGLLRYPGAFSPLVARLVEELGFEGVYLSGAVVAAELGYPDVGLTTLTEVADRARLTVAATNLPVLVDADTGFGEPLNVARTVAELERAGATGCHVEDQVNPKRCGHLDGKELVAPEEMQRKLDAAVRARADDAFLVVARTDARGVTGFDDAVARARRYADAGADAIFAEALADEAEIAAFCAAMSVPVLVNMTEFGKTELVPADRLAAAGARIAIYPVTTLRLAVYAVRAGLEELARAGTQQAVVARMQTRAELYELLRYGDFADLDESVSRGLDGDWTNQ
jgi:methylisocitrate lyase